MFKATMGSFVLFTTFIVFTIQACNAILIPKHYDLHLVVDPFNKTLSGSVKIRVYAENKTDIVQLSADPSIVIKNVTINSENATDANLFNVTKIEKAKPDGLNLFVNQKLTKNRTFIVHIKFEGIKPGNSSLNNSVYILNLADKNFTNVKSFFVIDLTKQTSKAVFPCIFDSSLTPFKATFNLTISRPKSFKLLTISHSNISHIQSPRYPNYYEDAYWQTIPISIRSFALIATNNSETFIVTRRENGTCSKKPINYGLNRDMLICMVDQLSKFFGTLMPGNSISIIVVPESSNISIQAFSLLTVSDHFRGDAKNVEVTLRVLMWHLGEQWISYRVHSINPNSSHLIHALGRFAALEIFPKLIEKSNASGYNDFDDVLTKVKYETARAEWSRNKNAPECYLVNRNLLVFNMVKKILGEKLFSEGLADLLSKSNHNPIKDDDIWRHLTHIAMKYEAFDVPDFPQSVEEIVNPFINRSLFSIPLLEFDFDFYGSFGGFIRQIPYAFTQSTYDNELYANLTGSPLWKVPIQLVLENENFTSQQKSFVWAKTRNRAIALTNFSQKEILLLNPEIIGPFIVKYRKNNWDMIFERFDSLPLKYKRLLLHDLHVLAHSHHYNYTEYIKYLPKLKPTQSNLPIWRSFLTLIPDVENRLFGNSKKLVKKMFVKQLTDVYQKFFNSSKKESPFWIKDLSDSVAKYLCTNGAPVCNRTAAYETLLRNMSSPDACSSPYSCGAMANATYDQWYKVLKEVQKYYKNYTSCQRCCVMRLLTECTSNKQALTTFLKMMFQNYENVSFSLQNTPKWDEDSMSKLLRKIKKSDEGSSALFEFFSSNFNDLKKKYPQHFKTILSEATRNIKSEEDIKKAIEFLKKNSSNFGEPLIVEDNIRRLEEQIIWMKDTLRKIEEFLTEVFKTPEKYFG